MGCCASEQTGPQNERFAEVGTGDRKLAAKSANIMGEKNSANTTQRTDATQNETVDRKTLYKDK